MAVGIELHNHRFWYGAPTSQELIASNGIHAGLVVGTELPVPRDLDLDRETASLAVNGLTKASAPCLEIMGGPLRSVRWLARHTASRGLKLRAGELIIPGSAVELIRVRAGDSIEARISNVGTCRARLT
jgi:2-keto-4-pentenoate hydratase